MTAFVKRLCINKSQYKTGYTAAKGKPSGTHTIAVCKLCRTYGGRAADKCTHNSTCYKIGIGSFLLFAALPEYMLIITIDKSEIIMPKICQTVTLSALLIDIIIQQNRAVINPLPPEEQNYFLKICVKQKSPASKPSSCSQLLN